MHKYKHTYRYVGITTHTEVNPTFCLTFLQAFTYTHKILEKKSLVFWESKDDISILHIVSIYATPKYEATSIILYISFFLKLY